MPPLVLAHPNCILFITHGGLLSTTETVHFGVPIIGIPVFADQFINVDKSVSRGFAKRVDLSHETPKRLKVAISEVIGDPSYREKAKYLSLVYHDRPVPPGRLLVHWVEHAVKTRGAPHLRSRALSTPWHQKTYLDLAALVAVVTFGLYITAKRLFKSKFLTAAAVAPSLDIFIFIYGAERGARARDIVRRSRARGSAASLSPQISGILYLSIQSLMTERPGSRTGTAASVICPGNGDGGLLFD
ncbi:UDP-glucuronosyltransferase 2B1 [Eumeta japonica]|uniref:UDP-glucuronosyltransferase 2B1 n=1 Tax=Eumeta variegata TaxID=151549 RepID=A0A4C1VSN5_EUMVA|nr:UDP-glucuronosyltransferase 2B1 [Eumeta japonica]